VGPFALAIGLGERKSPSSASDFWETLVEPRSDARTMLADFFRILLEAEKKAETRKEFEVRKSRNSELRTSSDACRAHRACFAHVSRTSLTCLPTLRLNLTPCRSTIQTDGYDWRSL